MNKTKFVISKMDCPSEEQMVRMKLDGLSNVVSMQFDIPNRSLDLYHTGNHADISDALDDLNLGATFVETAPADGFVLIDETAEQRKLLWQVLAVNFSFFVLEISAGFFSGSMGLIADSLDMLADAFVYAISLFAVGATLARKKNIARIAGYFQIALAAIGFAEVIRRFLGVEEMPDFSMMIIVSALALVANGFCLYLLQRSKSQDAHMQASTIFTSNDVIINLGVIAAGILVFLLGSNKPDLVIGTLVFVVVMRGAIKILKIAR